MALLNPNERWLVESGINRYKLIGPGWVWVKPWQKMLTRLDLAPRGIGLQFNEVRTAENIPLKVNLQLLFQVNPDLFTTDLLPKLPDLNKVGWQHVLNWRTEHTLRALLARYTWTELSQAEIQTRLNAG